MQIIDLTDIKMRVLQGDMGYYPSLDAPREIEGTVLFMRFPDELLPHVDPYIKMHMFVELACAPRIPYMDIEFKVRWDNNRVCWIDQGQLILRSYVGRRCNLLWEGFEGEPNMLKVKQDKRPVIELTPQTHPRRTKQSRTKKSLKKASIGQWYGMTYSNEKPKYVTKSIPVPKKRTDSGLHFTATEGLHYVAAGRSGKPVTAKIIEPTSDEMIERAGRITTQVGTTGMEARILRSTGSSRPKKAGLARDQYMRALKRYSFGTTTDTRIDPAKIRTPEYSDEDMARMRASFEKMRTEEFIAKKKSQGSPFSGKPKSKFFKDFMR